MSRGAGARGLPARIGLVAVGATLFCAAAAGAAGFTAQSSNPSNTFTAAASFCSAPGIQTVSASKDSYVADGILTANTNFGSSTTLEVRSGALLSDVRRALVAFDLPSVPSRCTVTAASLRLYASAPSADRTIDAIRISGPWTEAGVTWSNQPGTTGTAASSASLSSAGVQSWDVLSQVEAMYSGTNDGFMIRDATETGLVLSYLQTYQSREGTDPARDPELRVTFG